MNKQHATNIVLLVLIIALFYVGGAYISLKREGNIKDNAVNVAINDTTSYSIDRNGRQHGEEEVLVGDLRTVVALKQYLIDSLSYALKVKSKDIKSIGAVSTVNSGEIIFLVDTVYVDSAGKKKKELALRYEDKWIYLRGVVGGKENKINYIVYDSLILTTYNKHYGFLNLKTRPYINAYSINPHSKIKGMTGVKIDGIKPKKFSFGFGVGYGFNGSQFQPMVGVQLQYSIIRF